MSPAVTTPSPCFLQVEHRFLAVVQLQHDALQVEQDVDDILLHAVDGGVLVQHPADLDLGRRKAGHRGQQHPAQSVAQRVAIAALERLHGHLGVEGGDRLNVDDARLQKVLLCISVYPLQDRIAACGCRR